MNLLRSDYWRCRAAEQGENGLHYRVLGKGPAINQKAGSMQNRHSSNKSKAVYNWSNRVDETAFYKVAPTVGAIYKPVKLEN